MHRRSFDSLGKIINTFGDFPEAMRQTAKEENVPLIDLKRDEQNAGGGFGTEGRNGHLFMWQLILSQIQKLNSI